MNTTRKDETNPFFELLPRYRAALESLATFAIPVAPSSRLRLYERRLEQAAGESRVIEPALADALTFDLREIAELRGLDVPKMGVLSGPPQWQRPSR